MMMMMMMNLTKTWIYLPYFIREVNPYFILEINQNEKVDLPSKKEKAGK